MKKIEEGNLKKIKGGGISAAYITAIVRGINTIIDLGRALGTALRRIQTGTLC